ncbi:MAG TPA: hypothetical protein VGB75_07145 [Jatrophihabitans sp.]|uniref:hypothetical protein n=1 Tax=Jatrophihabitans sp. TaxID=1932789 RepID=UPI002F1C5947
MIVGVAGCPNPPLLLHGVTGRPVAEVEQLRTACLAAIGELLAAGPSRLVVVGGAARGEDDKALSIVVGRLLLSQAGCRLPIEHLVIAADSPPADCLRAGRALAAGEEATGLLVMADGSARRSLKAPGYLDARAAPFDEGVRACLSSGRLAGLADLDPVLAAELLVAGRAAWQVLAGAVGEAPGRGHLRYSDDPFGVWYPVFTWAPASMLSKMRIEKG